MRKYDNGTYRDMTEAEIAEMNTPEMIEMQIEGLKQKLSDTDYVAIKYAEGWLSESEYAETKAQRQAWRDEINHLETDETVKLQKDYIGGDSE